jgi:DNA helicase-2/ATP-dependent DNA helicase PcrA
VARLDPDQILDGLNDAQREAVLATTGPVAILAGAGTGKTRVISHRVAYAVATGVVDPGLVLVVTFTEKAAAEMVGRLRRLGLPGITARTFHAHALTQLRHFWPSRHDGAPLPDVLDSKIPIVVRLARALPGGYRFTPAKDLADEIEWAKSRRIPPPRYLADAVGRESREPPIPPELFARLYADYERAKSRANRLDFDDMLTLTVELLEDDAEAAALVRARKRWFSVDEYQDTNPLQERLLELWAGDSRDVCVVGDEDQTIYTFTGATSTFLTGFADRHPGTRVVALIENYRSTPQILGLANRLLAGSGREKRLVATRPDGPLPAIRQYVDGEAELRSIVGEIRRLLAEGVEPAGIAILVRMNAQLPAIERGLAVAAIPYRVRGVRFFGRRDVRSAVELIRRSDIAGRGRGLEEEVRKVWKRQLGFDESGTPDGEEARERQEALETLLAILAELAAEDPDIGAGAYLAALAARDVEERGGEGSAVELLTYHRAKGLEWDAVFLPMLEDGALPIRQALDDPEALAEERRLFYVGLTRARRHLVLSWAARRTTPRGESRRTPSRFVVEVEPRGVRGLPLRERGAAPATNGNGSRRNRPAASDNPLFEALRAWRFERAKADGVPAYVVAHDTTLAAIADARPSSLDYLALVKGLGPTKLERYGSEIIAVVAAAREDGAGRDPAEAGPATGS